MALGPYALTFLCQHLHDLAGTPDNRGRLLAFSYPDLVVLWDKALELLGYRATCPPEPPLARQTDASILRWHKALHLGFLPESVDFFSRLGWALDAVDWMRARGMEQLADLNDPLPAGMHGVYDCVLDNIAGQCFNVAMVLENALRAVRVGGRILHLSVVARPNHGFYSLSPTLFHDFYTANGCKVLSQRLVKGMYRAEADLLISAQATFPAPVDAVLLTAVEKSTETPSWVTRPGMGKFLRYPDSRLPSTVPPAALEDESPCTP